MSRTSAWLGLVALSLAVSACQGTDPLSVIDNPAGDAAVMHVLLDPQSHAICAARSLSDPCDEQTADVLVSDVAAVGDVKAEWTDNRTLWVKVASGKITRQAARSRDGRTRIEVIRK